MNKTLVGDEQTLELGELAIHYSISSRNLHSCGFHLSLALTPLPLLLSLDLALLTFLSILMSAFAP